MSLNPLYMSEQLPATSLAAIREFDTRFLAAITAAKPTGWADALGGLVSTKAPLISFPVSQLRSKYLRTTGEQRFKTLREKSIDIKPEEFDDGYEARLQDILLQAFAYARWQEAAARLVLAEEQFRHDQIATMLEAGTTAATCVDGKAFFATDHPANMTDTKKGGTWSNYQASVKNVVSIANIEVEATSMRDVKDENGARLGVVPDTIIVPSAKYEPLKNLLSKDLILDGGTSTSVTSAATSNPYKGRFNVIEAKELTDVDDWYLVDSKLAGAGGLSPWLAVRQTVAASLALRVFGEESDFFKNTGRIKMSSHIWYGFGLGLPHAIRLIKGA